MGAVLTFDTKNSLYWSRRLETYVHDHSLNPICSRSLYHEMKMIVHQAIGMKLPACLFTRRTQGLEKTFSIQIVPKNLFTPIASSDAKYTSGLNSQPSRTRQFSFN